MADWIRQLTSGTVTPRLGPFIDIDGAPLAGLTISQADVRLSKNGGDFAQKNDATTATHDEGGWYIVTFNSTDFGTLGTLDISIQETGALPYFKSFMIVSPQVWDSVFSTDKLQVDAVEISSSTAAADAVEANIGNLDDSVAGVQTDVTAILADTNELQTDWTNGGRLDLIVDATLADTNELQTDWVNGGRLDLILDATSTFDHTTDGVLLNSTTQGQIDSIESSFSGVGIAATTVGTPSTTSVQLTGTDLGDTTGDHNRQYLFFTSGPVSVLGVGRWISSYTATGANAGTVTFDGGANDPDGPLPQAPGSGVTCRILGRR